MRDYLGLCVCVCLCTYVLTSLGTCLHIMSASTISCNNMTVYFYGKPKYLHLSRWMLYKHICIYKSCQKHYAFGSWRLWLKPQQHGRYLDTALLSPALISETWYVKSCNNVKVRNPSTHLNFIPDLHFYEFMWTATATTVGDNCFCDYKQAAYAAAPCSPHPVPNTSEQALLPLHLLWPQLAERSQRSLCDECVSAN